MTKKRIHIMSKKKRLPILISLSAGIVIGLITFYISKSWINSAIGFLITFTLGASYGIANKMVKNRAEIRKMEEVFPDFIELVSSNLRAGMTIDKALLTSSRKEFAPLDREILELGRDIITGGEISQALKDMAQRTQSEKIKKTMLLIISGLKAGGNISVLLEETATNVRERSFVEKRAASNVLMYLIFISFAVAVGAPILFGLSSVLVQVLTNILGSIPATSTNSVNFGFTLTKVNISITFLTYYIITFLMAIDCMAALILGLVNKGEEKSGIKYIIPLIAVSLAVFFIVKIMLTGYFSSFFG